MVKEAESQHNAVAKLAKNSVFVFLTRVIDLIIALLSTALIARYLGVVNFGYYAFVMAIAIFLVPIADFGLERVITREIASDNKSAGRYFGSAIIARIFLSVIIVVIVFAITASSSWDDKIVYGVYISTLTQLFISMSILIIGTFRAFERMEYELLLNFVFNIIYIVLVIAVIKLDWGFLSIFVTRVVASFIHMAILFKFAVSRFAKPVLNIDFKLLRYLLKEGLPLGLFSFFLTASFKVDIFVLNYLRTPEEVSLFEAAHKVIMQLQILPTSIAIALFPYFSKLAGESNDSLRFSFNRSFKLMLIISLPISILLIFTSDFIISTLYDESFSAASMSLSIMSFTIAFLFIIALNSFVLVSKGRQGLNTVSVVICFLLNLLLDFILVPRYGFIGASYATLISYIALFGLSMYFVYKTIGMPPIGETLPKPLISSGVMAVGSFLLYNNNGRDILMVAEAVILLIIYGSMIFLLRTFEPNEIDIIKKIFLRRKVVEKAV